MMRGDGKTSREKKKKRERKRGKEGKSVEGGEE